MDWKTRWRQLWRHQPTLWALTAALAVMQVLNGGLSLFLGRTHLTTLQRFMRAASAARGPGAFPIFAPRSASAQVLLSLVSVLSGVLMVLIVWTVRLAFEHPERPLPWRAVWRRFWIPLLRALIAYAAQSVLLILLFMVVGVPLVILVNLAAFLCSPVPVLILAAAVGLGLMWWLLPWWMNFLIAAVVEHPASPVEVWQRYWGVMRTYGARFRSLATWQMLFFVVLAAPLAALSSYPWLRTVTTLDPLAVRPEVPLWVWPLLAVLGVLTAVGGAYLLVGWASAYLDASRAWQARARRLAAALHASEEVSP